MAETFTEEFYRQGALQLAPKLLGQLLVTESPEGRTAGRIVEVEAYVGPGDRAAHSYGGRRTKRTEVQFRPGGQAYPYFIYGMYVCLNITCAPAEKPECVLLRALEPVEGIDLMARRRAARNGKSVAERELCRGPGRLCLALDIRMDDYGAAMTEGRLRVERGERVPRERIVQTPRIGVDYAGEDALLPWRFFVEGSPFVSGTRKQNRPTESV